MQDFTVELGLRTNIPVVHTKKNIENSTKYNFDFTTESDRDLAMSANKLLICEDVVTTFGSIDGIGKLLRPDQIIHSLAMLLRGKINAEYQKEIIDHYLFVREIPTDKDEFHRRLNHVW